MTFDEFATQRGATIPEHNRLKGLDTGNPHPQYAISDHVHDAGGGTDLTAHIAAVDPHTGYVRESTVGTVGGPAGPLDAGGKVPAAQIPAGAGAAFHHFRDLREFGTVDLTGGTDHTTLMQTAVNEILTGGSGMLFVPAGTIRLTGLVQFMAADGSKAVDLLGAGHSRTVFNMSGADARLAFGFPAVDGTVAGTSTTTTIDAATGTFPTNAVGRQVTVLVGGNKQVKTIATRVSDTQITLSSALTAAPDSASAWAVSGPASRGGYAGHFSLTCGHIAKQPLYVGQGAGKFFEHIRIFRPLELGSLIESTQNSSFAFFDITESRGDNIAVTRSAKNIDIIGLTASTARVSGLHIYEGGLSHVVGSDTPEKIKLWGGILEEDDGTAGAYIATVLIDDGDLIELHGTTVSNGATATTTAAVRLRRTVSKAMQLLIEGGQYSAMTGIGIDTGGGTTGQPLRVFIGDGTFLRSSGSTVAFLQPRDDHVRVRVGEVHRSANQTFFAAHASGTALRSAGDVVTYNGVRTLIKPGDTPRNNASLAADPHLTAQAESGAVYEVRLQLFVDGPAGADFKYDFTVPTGSTFIAGRSTLGTGDSTSTGQPNFASHVSTDTIQVGTVGAGTKLSYEITGLLRVGSTTGTFALRWAQVVPDAVTATTLFTDSFMTLRKVS